MEVIKVTKDNFENEVKNSPVPVLIDFNAGWCGPCRMLRPVLDEIAGEENSVKIVSVDIDDEDELADEYGVSSIPCLVLIENGEEKDRVVGFRPKDDILEFIRG